MRLIGKNLEMSLREDRTAELWKSFMPHRATVQNRVGTHFMSMQVYPVEAAGHLSPDTTFHKWAVVEVSSIEGLPSGMSSYHLQGGRYAVFIHKGPAHTFPQTMVRIFNSWLPSSEYELDSREHFELLEEGYSPTDPDASEEIWIPIK